MDRFRFVLAVALTVMLDMPGSAAELPFFAAFKSFCVNTGGAPDAVGPAVEMAGGKQLKPITSSGGPYFLTAASWWVMIDGHKILVSSGTSRHFYSAGRVSDSTNCTITSYANEDDSIAKIQQWVSVPPDWGSATGPRFYSYQKHGDVRQPMPADKAATASIMETGHSSALVIVSQTNNFTSVQLTHLLAVTSAP